MAQRQEGWRAPGSGVGYPHGKDKRKERARRVMEQLKERAKAAADKAGKL